MRPPRTTGISVEQDLVPVRDWDRFVDATAGALSQRAAWARLKGEAFTQHVIVTQSEGCIQGGASLLERNVAGVARVGTVSGGPIVDGLDAAETVVSQMLAFSRRRKHAALLVSPAIEDLHTPKVLLQHGFVLSAVHISPPATVLIDLSCSIEDLFSHLPKSRRRATRRAESAGVTIRQGTSEDLELFAELHATSAAAHGFHAQPVGAIRRMWDELSPSGSIFLFVAELEGEGISADLLVMDGDRLVDKLTGSSGTSEARIAQPSVFLHWHLIKWAKEQGFRYLDYGGLRLDIAERLIDGTATKQDFNHHHDYFKLSMGGSPTLLPRTYVYSRVPLGKQLIQLLGGLASKPGRANRILNRLRN